MYFPYVRGRQYELLALKDLIGKDLICDKVIPVIEPVKLTSTLINTISEYVKADRRVGVVLNPGVGNFLSECKKAQPKSKEKTWCDDFESHCNSSSIIPSLIMNLGTSDSLQGRSSSDFLIIHNDSDFLDDYERLFGAAAPRRCDEQSWAKAKVAEPITLR